MDPQQRVRAFVDSREWEIPGRLKDLLLNIVEETGEAWNLIKWTGPEREDELIEKSRAEFKDFVGDVLYLVMRVANTTGVDAMQALEETLDEYESRFPQREVTGKTTNVHAGGIDHKYDSR
jgi:NTP pyrophosphatase (non-canonical NTP hydrolase)